MGAKLIRYNTTNGISGTGNLAQISFNAINSGTTIINFSETLLINNLEDEIMHEIKNGNITIN